MKKRFLVIFVIILLLSTSMLSMAAENTNGKIYPHPVEGLGFVTDQRLNYTSRYDYYLTTIDLNGPGVMGSVRSWQASQKGIQRLYTLEVEQEGMVKLNFETHSMLDKGASLSLMACMNYPYSGSDTLAHWHDVFIKERKNEIYPYVIKNYIFYAYPGIYYFHISGTNENDKSDYTVLDYTISASQEVYTDEFSEGLGNQNDVDYPNDLGETTLFDQIFVKSTRSMVSWRKKNSSGGLTAASTNSYDKFDFTAEGSGKVNVTINNYKTNILDDYLQAKRATSDYYTDFVPKLTVSISPYMLRSDVEYGKELKESIDVEAGESYTVEIGGSSGYPMSYSIDLAYSDVVSDGTSTSGASSWAVDEIDQSINAGLKTSKMMQGDYTADATREEFAELVMKLYDQLGGASVSSSQNPFTDTTNSEIVRAANAGIINGTSATTFGSNENLTREQLCVMILRTLDATDTNYNMNMAFQKNYSDEALISSWALNSVRTLNSYKIINGSGDSLDPKSTVTKEVAILMMYRAYNMFK